VCPYAGHCPGCACMHVDFTGENELKNTQFREFAVRAGFAEDKLVPPLAPEPETGYRNKLVLHVNKAGSDVMIGYVGSDNQTVFPVEKCCLAHPEINEFLAGQLADPGFRHTVHHRMELTYRRTDHGGVFFFRNKLPRGVSWLRENTILGELACPADGFFQVNTNGANALLRRMEEELRDFQPETILDLYCGAGLFSAAAAHAGVKNILGAEIAENSVEAARYNLKKLGRPDAEFISGDAAGLIRSMLRRHPDTRTMLVMDPPRGGILPKMQEALVCTPPGTRLVYISCNPATWARDAARLIARGFVPVRAGMLNQFARTGHFEVISVLDKGLCA